MAVIGFMAEEPGLAELKDDTWVEVTGTLDSLDFDVSGNGKAAPVPLIKAESIEKPEKTASSTIFPY